jgi:FkbM family methyltransferase
MSFLTPLGKPQYLFRPQTVLRRLLVELRLASLPNVVNLPWGATLEIDLHDPVGQALALQGGLYDIVTTEIVWRLAGKGETCFDVGANVGYFTSILAHRVGNRGKVVAFEPHPATFLRLQKNAALQPATSGEIALNNVALTDFAGEGTLDLLPDVPNHVSYAFLTDAPSQNGIRVSLDRGERYMRAGENAVQIGVMKIDAQWQEAKVLAGFGEALKSGAIRDIVFEEDAPFPAPSHQILIDAGYTLFWFEETLRGPRMIDAAEKPKNLRAYDILPSYLATRHAERAQSLLSPSGWQSF